MNHRKRELSWQTLCLSFASTQIWVLFSSRFYCFLDELTKEFPVSTVACFSTRSQHFLMDKYLYLWRARVFFRLKSIYIKVSFNCLSQQKFLKLQNVIRGIRGGGHPTNLPPEVRHSWGGALLILHLLAFPFLRQSTFYIVLHCTYPN